PTIITGDKLEYQYREKIASISGNVVFKQSDRTAKAQKAVFNQNTEIIVLSGGVDAFDEKGQKFQTPADVKISIKPGDEWIEAQQATATFKIDLDDEDNN
ncbi:MAG: LptA/OstA family protein, partial [Armatimonadota bacterium]